MEPLICVILKTVSTLMADLNAVSNPEFLGCFAQVLVSLVCLVLKMLVNVSFFTT